ncbi:uncharacterized protein LOC133192803 [Saccostrea echinata]|uniref:uncharacterized protein LOC133192803 n=1 Tax=Saccostrea echinata TaxID=191078 RepID=UPI002A829EBA|nr:uncharacterized protein LOC133192803 [Saccostrea echinata]
MVTSLFFVGVLLFCIGTVNTIIVPHSINLSIHPIRPDCSVPEPGTKPFFFGTNNLACMFLTTLGKHRKKRSLKIPVHSFVHSFIYYDGWFAEFGTKETTLRTRSPRYPYCGPKLNLQPAGYSKLPFDCLRRCASKYHLAFGKYHLFKNNCHYFSNRMMHILCHEVTCPVWCL